MMQNKHKVFAVILMVATISACNINRIELNTDVSTQSSSALSNQQPADAIIGQDFYDTTTMPMISDLGFGSLGDIVSNGLRSRYES